MRALRIFTVLFIVVLAQLIPAYFCFASPSSDFYREGADLFDDWEVCRTRGYGDDGFFQLTEQGFRPVIAFESLGEWADTAYSLGQQFADKYPDRYQRAEKVFYFVRDRVRYISDSDQFGFGEFAQNADELANTIQKEGLAYGDCEDMGALLAVMCQGAGYRSAIVLAPNHAAAMVHLPGYKKAIDLTFDGEPGWIWAEATGSTNPFGWFPEEFMAVDLIAYEISAEPISRLKSPDGETPPQPAPIVNSPDVTSIESLFYIVISLIFIIGLVMIIILLMRRRRA